MRLLLALLALAGLLMTPVAASAGAVFCFGHAAEAAAATVASVALPAEHAADHSGCDPDDSAPDHDSRRCAQACAAMCVAPAALAGPVAFASARVGRARVEAVPLKAFHAHAPPGLKRPPRTLA